MSTPEVTTPDEAAASRAGIHDVLSSLVVFLVALPLSLGIALASDAPIMAGLIAAAVGGIVVGLFGGAPLQVSGPAAGLTVTVFTLIESLNGDWRAVCFVVACAGVLQVVMGAFRVARLALAISPAVVHGMLAGIGISIFLGQLHVVLGGSPQSSALKNLRELPAQLADLHGPATALGLATIAILFVWPLIPVKKLKAIPAPLVAVLAATLVSLSLNGNVARISLAADAKVKKIADGHVVETPADTAPEPADAGKHPLVAAVKPPRVPTDFPLSTVLLGILTVALIASVESLLCAVATDKLHSGPRANLDRELIGQGLANTVSGLLGGLPVTGVIVRSSANIHSGAKTRLSAILHGVWILIFVLFLGFLIEKVPKAVLAGLLVFVGAKLVNVDHIRELVKHKEWPVYAITVGGIVLKDLLFGVGIGVVAAIFFLLKRLGHVEVRVRDEGGDVKVEIAGSVMFIAVPKLMAALEKIAPRRNVVVDLDVSMMDHAGLEALHSWKSSYERTGGTVDMDAKLDDAFAPGRTHEGRMGEAAAVSSTSSAT